MVTTRPPKTIVKPTALGPVANTDTKLLIYDLFQKGRVLAQDGVADGAVSSHPVSAKGILAKPTNPKLTERARKGGVVGGRARASKLSPERRSEIARKAANARWKE